MKEIEIRRSVRQFSDKKVDESTIIEILKAGMQAPISNESTTMGIHRCRR